MNAELLAIGSELVCGASLDTNSQWLSCELEARGYTVTRHTTIADDLPAMIETLQAAAGRCRIVLITGGLGPTRDDITRDAIAGAFDQTLAEDAAELDHIKALFARFDRKMPERNAIQAMIPDGGQALRNNHGTAPGIMLELTDPDCLVAAMPGVPREMKKMFEQQLDSRLPESPVVVRRVMIRTFGYGESRAEELLGDLTARGNNPEVGITASGAIISLSVTARADSESECEDLIQPIVDTIHEKLGHAVFGQANDELHGVVCQMLSKENRTVALAEGTTTGGLLSQWLYQTQNELSPVVHSDRLVAGGEDTSDLLELCESIRDQADYAIVTSHSTVSADAETKGGIQEGQFGIVGPDLSRVVDVRFTGDLGFFRELACRMALNLIRLHLSGIPVEGALPRFASDKS